MADTQHTPTPRPWKTEGDGLRMLVLGADSTIVAVRHRLPAVVHEANAAHIVKCVNVHAALVEIAQAALAFAEAELEVRGDEDAEYDMPANEGE